MSYPIVSDQLADFASWLKQEEHSAGTIDKYLRDVRRFAQWLRSGWRDERSAKRW